MAADSDGAYANAPAGVSNPGGPVRVLLIGAPAIFFAGVCLFYLISFAVNVPFIDEWRFISFVDGFVNNHVDWREIFAQDNGHRVVAWRLADLLSAMFFHYDVRIPMVLGYCALAGAAGMFLYAYRKSLLRGGNISALLWAAIFALLFSLRNWENLLATWGISVATALFFVVCALALVSERSRIAFGLGIVCAIAASGSFTNGLLVWPLGAAYLVSAKRSARLGPWLIAAAIVLTLYLWKFTTFPGEALNIRVLMERLCALLGSPLLIDAGYISGQTDHKSYSLVLSELVGAALLLGLLAFAVLQRKILMRHKFPIALILYGLGSCGMIAIGRTAFGIEQALSARYFITAASVYIGILLLCVEALAVEKTKLVKTISLTLFALVIFASGVAMVDELRTGPYRRANLVAWRNTVLNYKLVADSALEGTLKPPSESRELIAMLERDRLGPFAQPK